MAQNFIEVGTSFLFMITMLFIMVGINFVVFARSEPFTMTGAAETPGTLYQYTYSGLVNGLNGFIWPFAGLKAA